MIALLVLGLLSLAATACDSMPTAPKLECRKWAGAPVTAIAGGFQVTAHPDSTCTVR